MSSVWARPRVGFEMICSRRQMALIRGQNVNNAAHVGGLLSGGLLGWGLSHAAGLVYQRFFEVAAWLLCAATVGGLRWRGGVARLSCSETCQPSMAPSDVVQIAQPSKS